MRDRRDVVARLAFRLAGIHSRRLWSLCEARLGDAVRWSSFNEADWRSVHELGPQRVAQLSDSKIWDLAKREYDEAAKRGIELVCPGDENFPSSFDELSDPPFILYVRGQWPQGKTVAVVGTRTPSVTGSTNAIRFSRDLARQGVVIASGLARGIDTMAHRGCLEVKGKTVAFLASGLLSIYPSDNAVLADLVLRHGALVSEEPLYAKPKPYSFPMRNRLMAAYSQAVLVVEAPRRSGALITADLALELGRDVFALPSSLNVAQGQGTNALLQEGALMALSAHDVLRSLGIHEAQGDAIKPLMRIGETREPILQLLAQESASEGLNLEFIISNLNESASLVMRKLSQFESQGVIRMLPGQRVALVSEE